MRWGPNIMPVDYFNRGVVFNMADFLSNTVSSVYPNAPAGLLYYGDKGVSRGVHQELATGSSLRMSAFLSIQSATAKP